MTATPAICENPRPTAWDHLPMTLPAALLAAAADTPIVYLDSQGTASHTSYGDLVNAAKRVAQGWTQLDLKPGNKVILQLSTSQDILSAFWGCLFAGLEPVIVPIPVSFDMPNRPLEQLTHLYELLDQPVICTTEATAQEIRVSQVAPNLKGASCVSLQELLANEPITNIHKADPNDIAFYTLSSGSTGLSKAVSLTHRNMISRGHGANILCANRPEDVILSWLPFDHIGNISAYHVSPILAGSSLIYAPKEYVLAKPLRWLDLIEQYRVTHGWAPNFAFGLVTKALQSLTTAERSWDLSCVKGLLSAGELIAYSTCEAFLNAVQPYGFRRDALISAFGMAEVCSGVAYHLPKSGNGIRFEHLDRRFLQDKIHVTSTDDPQCISFASLGPIAPGMAMRIVDEQNQTVNQGTLGRFQLKGDALMPGYYNNDEANKAFIGDGWFDTGDMGFILDDELYLVGRSGLGIIVNGANLSNVEIETAVEQVQAVEPSFTAACGVFAPGHDKLQLAVFFHSKLASDQTALPDVLKAIQTQLSKQVGVRADYLVPLAPEDIPKTAIGKIQHKRLVQRFQAGEFDTQVRETQSILQTLAANTSGSENLQGMAGTLATIWQDVLDQAHVGLDSNFFELGGDSLSLMQALERTNEAIGIELSLVDLFRFPSIRALVDHIQGDSSTRQTPTEAANLRAEHRKDRTKSNDVAVIGMSCRFPGADDLATFWKNISQGVESITFFDDSDLNRSGFSNSVFNRPDYVKASPLLSDVRGFDAGFFGYSARDAELMDPQQRLFLECSWEAFEDAGYDPTTYPGTVGVYAGAAMNTYLFNNVLPNRDSLDPQDDMGVTTLDSMGGFMMMVANDKDYLTTRVSYKLNLSGPSVNVQTACSTGLVAIHMACQSLIAAEADLFLAGGASIQSPEHAGHLYQPGMIVTPDGHVRSFDAKAGGTIFGSGVGAVLLKRLEDAIRDGDHIYAIVKGSAINNDGGQKVGYMAPSSEGQAGAVAEALAMADVPADSIGLVEAHGTGTVVGDPIEVNGLTQVYRHQTDKTGYCALGSVKTNVGHLQITSGTVGFIKTVLSVNHGVVPPMVNFETPNPGLKLQESPFFINTEPVPWPIEQGPRRAAVNSLGIGGTNAHAVIEQAPVIPEPVNAIERPSHLLMLSARSEGALKALAQRYSHRFAQDPGLSIANACFTANTGRKRFAHRLVIATTDTVDASAQLSNYVSGTSAENVKTYQVTHSQPSKVAFLFTGQGSQYIAMAKELYETQVVFREQIDLCAKLFKDQPGLADVDLIEALTSESFDPARLDQTGLAQPTIFALGYAMGRMWQSWGVNPSVVAGHSLGEYIAACIAGVFSLEDAVTLVAARARLMQALPSGGQMWAVAAALAQIEPSLKSVRNQVSVAADNAPQSVVISGDGSTIAPIIEALQADGIRCQRLNTSHAFHSPLMSPMLDEFMTVASKVTFHAPSVTLVSNVSGMVASEEVQMPAYWREHIRQPVQFRQSMQAIAELGCEVMLEIGPRPTLTSLGMLCLADHGVWLTSLKPGSSCWSTLLEAASELALRDALSLKDFDLPYKRRRVSLPTYPFEHTSYWLEPPKRSRTSQIDIIKDTLLGTRLALPTLSDVVFQNRLDVRALPLLNDHLVMGQPVVSAACYVSMMLQAIKSSQGTSQVRLQDIVFERPLIISSDQGRNVQVVIRKQDTSIELSSFVVDDNSQPLDIQSHAQGHWGQGVINSHTPIDIQGTLARCTQEIVIDDFLRGLALRKITLGPSYQWPESIRRNDREVMTLLRMPASLGGLAGDILHPGLLDACFGALLASGLLPEEATWLPFAMESIELLGELPSGPVFVYLKLRETQASGVPIVDAGIYDIDGVPLFLVSGLQAREASQAQLASLNPKQASSLMHDLAWVELRASDLISTDQDLTGNWLIFSDHGSLGNQLAKRLGERFANVTLIAAPAKDDLSEADEIINSALSVAEGKPIRGVVNLWGLDDRSERWFGPSAALTFLRELARRGFEPELGTILVTNRAATINQVDVRPEQTSLWGLVVSARHEHPELDIRICDLADPADPSACNNLMSTISAKQRHPWLYHEGQKTWHAQLKSAKFNPVVSSQDITKADSTYLVTGAFGALGLRVVQWLVEQGAKHLALIARKGPSIDQQEYLDDLRAAGVNYQCFSVDIANQNSVESVLKPGLTTMPALAGVIHCAGVLRDSPLQACSWEDVTEVLSGKCEGAWNLHQLTRDLPLDHFVMFSSAASVLGNAGQVSYAMANAYLDGLASLRNSMGLAGSSVNWGPWHGDGMATSDSAIVRQLSSQGFTPLDPSLALQALSQIIQANRVQTIVLDCDWSRYQAIAPASEPILDDMLRRASDASVTKSSSPNAQALHSLQTLAPIERRQAIERTVNITLSDLLGLGQDGHIPAGKSLSDLGLDSLMAVQLRNRLGAAVGRTLPVSLAFNYPSAEDLVQYLDGLFAASGEPDPVPTATSTTASAQSLLEDLDKLLQS